MVKKIKSANRGVRVAKNKEREDEPVRVHKEIVRRIKAISGFRGISMSEYLTEILRPIVAKDFEELAREKMPKGRE